ncbi:hypothetical protein [Halomonas koreensis]|uniref:Uncharacterized protein n=1 Tax=Halomonas koreensis TaxID=245385 RepID=A0ABU1G4P2_9GAMM|nr:hypothetical protein [Halomonas koreensis]MDR5867928.1 hypothetical protein [Halomonas koreensis]
MTDTTDLNALTSDELKEQARILEISLKGNPGDDTIRAKIREKLGQADPKDEPSTNEADTGIAVRRGEKRYKVQIHKDGKDKQPVFLGCNGRSVRIVRGETVTIGEGLFQSLKNAVETRFDTESEEWVEVPSYPYSVLDVVE